MKFIKLFLFSAALTSFSSFAQIHLAFEYRQGTMTGSQPGPWTKFENPAIQSFWINGQQGYVFNQQEAESVKQYLNEASAYRNINNNVKLEVEKIIQYFSSSNSQRELIKDYIPHDIRPLPVPKDVDVNNVQKALGPIWEIVKEDNVIGASSAINKVEEHIRRLTPSEQNYARSELNRLFTYPSGQLKNLPYLPTTPVNFNSSSYLKTKPFIRAINDLQVNEASLRKHLAHKGAIGATLQKERLKVESEKIRKALTVEEFKSHYFNQKSDFPSQVSGAVANADISDVVTRAEEIIRNNPHIDTSSPQRELSADESLLRHTAELSSCLERELYCGKIKNVPGATKEIQDIHQKISTLYETRTRSVNIRDPEIRNLSQNLVSYGHDKVLNDANDSEFYVDLATSVTDLGLGFVPIVGTAKDLVEFVTGKSLLTGEALDSTTRMIMATAVVIDLASFGTGGRLTKLALEGAANSFRTFAHSKPGVQIGRHWDDVEGFTREVFDRVSYYEFENPIVAKSYAKLHEGLKTLPSKFKIYDVKEGVNNGKIAIIGRKMEGAVNDVANHLKEHGVEVETFKWTEDAGSNWKKNKGEYQNGRIPYEKVIETLGYKENKEWAERIIHEGYTIFDIRDPLGANVTEGFSPFYDIENMIIWGRLNL